VQCVLEKEEETEQREVGVEVEEGDPIQHV
jgi:hypothetical protein